MKELRALCLCAVLLVCAALALPFVAGAAGTTLVNDTFADANSQNQDLANNSLRVFNGRAVCTATSTTNCTTRIDAPGSVTFDLNKLGANSEGFWAFFTNAGSPVTLSVGEKLTVTETFVVGGFTPVTSNQDIRFALLDSKGSRTTSNPTGGMNNASFSDDTGYAMQLYTNGPGGPFTVGRRSAAATSANILSTMSDFPAVAGAAGAGAATTATLAADTPYTVTYSAERLTATDTRISIALAGGTLPAAYSYTAVDSGVPALTSFDTFAFRIANNSLAKSIKFTNMRVEYAPALPVITSQPQPTNLVVQVGSSVTMSVAATGNTLSYQWQKNGAPVAGNASAATPTLSLTNVQPADAGSYVAVVSNPGGSVTSAAVTLGVSTEPVPPPPSITAQPADTNVTVGGAATLSVQATGDNLFYQWFKDGVLIPGAKQPALNFAGAAVADTASYAVVVSNSSGSTTSAPARLLVVSPMTANTLSPAGGAGELNVDVPLGITFDRAPSAGTTGKIRVFNEDGTLFDQIDMAADTNPAAAGTQSQKQIGGVTFNYSPVVVSGNTAYIYLHQKLAYGQTYYVTLDPGVVNDAGGAPFAGLGDVNLWRFSTKAAGPAPGTTSLTVAADGSGDFNTVQGAVDFVPAGNTKRTVINVRRGTYTEIVYVPSSKPFVTVRGEDREQSVVQYANNNVFNPTSTTTRAMFGTDAADFTLENITLRNTTPKGGSQAEAFRGNNNRIVLNRVSLYSFQDTLLLQSPSNQGGFVTDSYVEGDVDFAWGVGTVFFQNTELKMVTSGAYFTQIRNVQGRNGYVFSNCKLTGAAGVTNAYLSRIDPNVFPYSQVVFINTQMQPQVVIPAGWLLNNATAAPNVQFWEYNSTDLNGVPVNVSQRAAFSRQMTPAEAAQWSNPSFVLGGWTPQTKLTAGVSLGNLTQSYTGAPAAAAVTTDPAGLSVEVTYNGSTQPPTAIGSYAVVASVQDATYQGTATGTLVISPVSASITLGNLYQTYDGTPKAVSVGTNPAGAPVAVTYNGSTAPPVAAGRYTVLATTSDPGFAGSASATLTVYAPGERPVRAFPGAEGGGELTPGGRGGDVYHVTNLNDSGAGSLREGVRTANGPRTIVFDVSGTINLASRLSIGKPFLTIAGQTAPGDGITVAGWNVIVSNTHDVIIRYLRFRAGDANCPAYQDDAFGVDKSANVIVDHVSASWSVDETLSVTESDKVTVQWSFITESMKNSCHEKGTHGYGSLIRYGSGLVTYHHNLYAHHYSRNPRVGDNIGLDFVNNVVYDWGLKAGYSADATEGSPRVNYVGNYLVAGPSTPASNRTRAFEGGSTATKIYQSNNLVDSNVNGARDGSDLDWAMVVGAFTRQQPGRFDFSQVQTDDARTAYERVLKLAGHSLARDAVDARIISEVEHEGGRQIDSPSQVGGYPALNSAPAPADTDRDGIPDIWEDEHGLNPSDAADGRLITPSGYSNLELYLNDLVPVPGADTFDDHAAPAVVATPSQSPNEAGWNNADVTLALAASDGQGGSGVREIVYTVNGRVVHAHDSSAEVAVNAEGTTTVSFYAIDNAGNAGAAQTLAVKLDKTAPSISDVTRTAPNGAGWNNTDVVANYSATDSLSGFASGATLSDAVSFTQEGENQFYVVEVTDLAGNTARQTVSGVNIDKTPPAIEAARLTPANAAGWNNTDVAVAYTASDATSGLAPNSPASGEHTFAAEGAGQSVTFTVEDLAGNKASATVGGINVDKTAPTVSLTKPAEGDFYFLGQAVAAGYACGDNLSDTADCAGTVASAAALDTASVGPKTFKVVSTDLAGNVTTRAVNYAVGYNLGLLYDPAKPNKAGSTVPVKLQLADSAGSNLSSAERVVHALGTSPAGADIYAALADAGNANPGQNFRFDPTLGTDGGYIFNLKTVGYAPGNYKLYFTVGADPHVYTAQFQVR